MREAISAEERVVITLRYLSQGMSQQTLCCSFRVGRQTVSDIVKEVCIALHDVLGPPYLRAPIIVTTRTLLRTNNQLINNTCNYPYVFSQSKLILQIFIYLCIKY